MPEPEGGNAATTEAKPISPKKSKSMLIPIVGGAAVFIVFIIIFSLKFGVFSSANVQPAAADKKAEAKKDSVAEVAAEPKEKDPYDGLFADFEDSHYAEETEDTAAVKDSVAKVAWYVQQKQEIEQQMSQLQIEKTQLQSLKSEVDALLQRKKALEEGNVTQMAKLYEGMATEEVVPILANLTDSQVSIMISKMKKQKASEILGKLPPERAAKITQYIISMSDN